MRIEVSIIFPSDDREALCHEDDFLCRLFEFSDIEKSYFFIGFLGFDDIHDHLYSFCTSDRIVRTESSRSFDPSFFLCDSEIFIDGHRFSHVRKSVRAIAFECLTIVVTADSTHRESEEFSSRHSVIRTIVRLISHDPVTSQFFDK